MLISNYTYIFLHQAISIFLKVTLVSNFINNNSQDISGFRLTPELAHNIHCCLSLYIHSNITLIACNCSLLILSHNKYYPILYRYQNISINYYAALYNSYNHHSSPHFWNCPRFQRGYLRGGRQWRDAVYQGRAQGSQCRRLVISFYIFTTSYYLPLIIFI